MNISYQNTILLNLRLQRITGVIIAAKMSGLAGLDRKAMELERLARVSRKRLLETTIDKDDVEIETEEKKRQRITDLSIPNHLCQGLPKTERTNSSIEARYNSKISPLCSSSLSHPINEKIKLGVQYPNGVIKKTWAQGFSRKGDDISIEEVLQKDDLTLAVLSAFQIDTRWILGKLSDKTRVYWVLQAKTDDEKQEWMSQASSMYKFCFPSMRGNIRCMHSKLQLLAHPSHLRIVVPTANLVSYDWGENGIMENMVFLIDLPRLENNQTLALEDLTNFGKELTFFLEAKGLPENVITSLRKFDFSRTNNIGFVHSIGGSHTGSLLNRTGFCGLASTINQLGLKKSDPILIDFITASLGNISPKFIETLYTAAQGTLELPPIKSQNNSSTNKKSALRECVNNFCRIYFPSRKTVESSLGGLGAGGTICFQSRWWSSNHFLQHIIRDCKSRRQGMLMHSKLWFVRSQKPCSQHAWAYIGSANLSESAWGRVSMDKNTKKPRINCANWECGVIFPAKSNHNKVDEEMAEFVDSIPVPMIAPGDSYEGKVPWFFCER